MAKKSRSWIRPLIGICGLLVLSECLTFHWLPAGIDRKLEDSGLAFLCLFFLYLIFLPFSIDRE
jgi:hypothetical protein